MNKEESEEKLKQMYDVSDIISKSQLSKRIDTVSVDDLKEFYRKFSSRCLLLDDDVLVIKQFFKKLLED